MSVCSAIPPASTRNRQPTQIRDLLLTPLAVYWKLQNGGGNPTDEGKDLSLTACNCVLCVKLHTLVSHEYRSAADPGQHCILACRREGSCLSSICVSGLDIRKTSSTSRPAPAGQHQPHRPILSTALHHLFSTHMLQTTPRDLPVWSGCRLAISSRAKARIPSH